MGWWNAENKDIIDRRDIDGKIIFEENRTLFLNQIEWIIDTYKRFGPRNNQMVLQVAHPSDVTLDRSSLLEIDRYAHSG